MNVIRFRVDALNTFCELSAKVLEEISGDLAGIEEYGWIILT
jgi:hypothetical protein